MTEAGVSVGGSGGSRQGIPVTAENASVAPVAAEANEIELVCPPGAVPGNGSTDCPSDFPIKGNTTSGIYHVPEGASYGKTIPEFCFATAADAKAAGFRVAER